MAGTASAQQREKLFAALQLPSQLTRLSLIVDFHKAQELLHLGQLSSLVNLEHLELAPVRFYRAAVNWQHNMKFNACLSLPSQLCKLTCLRVGFNTSSSGALLAVRLQHLSGLTALQELAIRGDQLGLAEGSIIKHLPQLTALELIHPGLYVGGISMGDWTRLTALHSFKMKGGSMQSGGTFILHSAASPVPGARAIVWRL